jgi:hypothetical protein
MSFLVIRRLLLVPEVPLSTIVRDMEGGCGDDLKTTSYNCFCYTSSSSSSSSSSYFGRLISYEVEKACATNGFGFWGFSAMGLGEIRCHVGDGLMSGMLDP